MDKLKALEIANAVGKRPLTVKERHDFGEIWKSCSDIDRFELAARIRHAATSKMGITTTFVQVCAIVFDFDKRYGTNTIHQQSEE